MALYTEVVNQEQRHVHITLLSVRHHDSDYSFLAECLNQKGSSYRAVLTSANTDYCVAAGTVQLKPIADPFYGCINSCFCIKIHNVLLYSKRANRPLKYSVAVCDYHSVVRDWDVLRVRLAESILHLATVQHASTTVNYDLITAEVAWILAT